MEEIQRNVIFVEVKKKSCTRPYLLFTSFASDFAEVILTRGCWQTCSVGRVRCRIIWRENSPSLFNRVKDAVAHLLYSCKEKHHANETSPLFFKR